VALLLDGGSTDGIIAGLVYRWRKMRVGPVFGQIKQGGRLRQFLLRGKEKVGEEWKLWYMTRNLRKLHAASLG
jgi:Ni,Fe-hydrogenase III large subunit